MTKTASGSGFTLIELMVCVAVAGVLGTTMAMFHLHHRALSRGVAVTDEMAQTAWLVVDHLRRDARAASSARQAGEVLVLQGPPQADEPRRVSYRLQPGGGLVRVVQGDGEAGRTTVRFPRVVGLSAHPAGARALRIELDLEAQLAVVRRRQRVVATVLLEGGR